MANASTDDRLVWIDCEMTGLDPKRDELIEVAAIVTDFELNPLDGGMQVVIRPSDAAREGMSAFVTAMHKRSGLLTELDAGTTLEDAQAQVLAYIKQHVPQEAKAPIAGNSIGTDRMFLAAYMPQVDGHLHYRSVDVSSIKELARRWYPRVFFNAPAKDGEHRALADILESIREMQYYRSAVFVPLPGPTTEESKAFSRASVSSFEAACSKLA